MNNNFLNEMQGLLIMCLVRNGRKTTLAMHTSIIGKRIIDSVTAMRDKIIPINAETSFNFLEMIVESHKDNPRVMTSILGPDIIKQSGELYNKIQQAA